MGEGYSLGGHFSRWGGGVSKFLAGGGDFFLFFC